MKLISALALVMLSFSGLAQDAFNYSLEINPITIDGLPGMHSYVWGQYEGKWLIIGGRLDGLHARQPFNSFPESQNNTDIYVIDINEQQFWSASLNSLPTALEEQLQSTNMCHVQVGDTLYLAGGYAYSNTSLDHITFPNLTTVNISGLIDAVVNGTDITSYFKQVESADFAITGGYLGQLNGTFYLVGGHRFDGNYNPMGMPTYTQAYSNQIRKFTIDNSGDQLSFVNTENVTDEVHLHRRDYNLVPQIFPDGTEGFMMSAGVFQVNADLPFLYTIDVNDDGYTPQTDFNQYLCNYHSAKAALYDSANNQMHSLFFGGMSQYYYQNGNLVEDQAVPFVKTISRVSRYADGSLHEFALPIEMPQLVGSSAEFIPNYMLPQYQSEIIKLSDISEDVVVLGHIYGGILSPSLNPFSVNQTSTTSASNVIYEVKLIRNDDVYVKEIDGVNSFDVSVFPNPVVEDLGVKMNLSKNAEVYYLVSDANGKLIANGLWKATKKGENQFVIPLEASLPSQTLTVSFVLDGKYYSIKKVVKK